jgi:glycosyltransferase involved in cell wall biosynthesis
MASARPLRIGFMLATNIALSSGGNGVRMQAVCQAAALRRRGHEVIEMNPWQTYKLSTIDVVQFFVGGHPFEWIEVLKADLNLLVFAPMIDSNQPHWRYAIAAQADRFLSSRMTTVQGVLKRQAAAADLVVVRSSHEHDRMVKSLGTDPGKIKLVLNGAEPRDPGNPSVIREAFDLPEQFVGHVSAYGQGRKNVLRLIEACVALGYPLVIAGNAKEADSSILAKIREWTERSKLVRVLPFLTMEQLQSLYVAAKVFALPSYNEGTGLVAVEAAAQGAAGLVVTQNGGPPDYFLDMAQYVDPLSVESIKAGIKAAWERGPDPRLTRHVRENLTWDKSAESLEAAYLFALDKPRGQRSRHGA